MEYVPNVDDEKTWGIVQARLKKKKRRRAVYFLLAGLAICTALLTIGFVHEESNSIVKKEEIVKTTLSETEHPSKSFINEENKIKDIIFKEEHQIENTTIIKQTNRFISDKQKDRKQLKVQKNSRKNNTEERNYITIESRDLSRVGSQNNAINKSIDLPTSYALLNKFESQYLKYERPEIFLPFLEKRKQIVKENDKKTWQVNYNISYLCPRVKYNQIENAMDAFEFKRKIQKPLEAVTTQLGVGYKIKKRINLHVGLKFMQMHLESAYSFIDTTTVNTFETSTSGQNLVSKKISTTTINRTRRANYSTFQALAIETKIDFGLINRNNVSINLFAGFSKPIWSKKSGYSSDNYENIYDLETDEEKRYSSTFSDAILYGIDMKYRLNSAWSLDLQTSYRLSLKNITTKNALVHEKYNFLGIAFGTSHFF